MLHFDEVTIIFLPSHTEKEDIVERKDNNIALLRCFMGVTVMLCGYSETSPSTLSTSLIHIRLENCSVFQGQWCRASYCLTERDSPLFIYTMSSILMESSILSNYWISSTFFDSYKAVKTDVLSYFNLKVKNL